jgi:hypothetical protein
MKSNSLSCNILKICLFAATLCQVASAHAHLCDFLFRESSQQITRSLLDQTWVKTAEAEYSAMLIELGVVAKPGETRLEQNAGTIVYSYWQRHPAIDHQFLKIGFSIVENDGPARFDFPKTFSDLVVNVEAQSGGNFKIATYNSTTWFKLDQQMSRSTMTEVATDLSFLTYANLVADGYTPMWPGRSSLALLHDLSHVTEYIEHQDVFPALQRFFKNYLSEYTPKSAKAADQTRSMQRAKFFNEVSYILKPKMYAAVDSLMVTEGVERGSLPVHTMQIRKALQQDMPRTLARIQVLTDAFDGLFFRHGGGARDVFAIDIRLSQSIIEAYIAATKADPAISTLGTTFPSGFLHEFIESPEGLKRQIQIVSKRLEAERSVELENFLAFRVAQLEVAILVQRQLQLTQVDIIQDSMLPLGAESKTSHYLQAYLPPTAKLSLLYKSALTPATLNPQ